MTRSTKIITALSVAFLALSAFSYRIYTQALYQFTQRVPLLYVEKCEKDTLGEIFNWNFEEVEGNEVKDVAGHGHNGMLGSLSDNHRLIFRVPQEIRNLANPKSIDTPGGKSLRFNGSNWVNAGNKRCLATGKFSIAMWFWKDKFRPIVKGDWLVPTLAAKSNWPSSGWWLCTQPNTNNIDMAISTGPKRRHIHSGYEVPVEEWHHVCVTMNNATHEIQFFIDGKLFGEKHTDVPEWATNWDQNLYVGDYDGTARWPWIGRIDDVHYFASELAPEAVGAMYDRESKARGI